MSDPAEHNDVHTTPEFTQKVEARWQLAKKRFQLDDGYLTRVANEEVFMQLFEVPDRDFLVMATISELTTALTPNQFNAVNAASEVYTVIGATTFYASVEETVLNRPDWQKYLLAHLIVFVAGTEGSADPKAMVDGIVAKLPHDPKLMQLIEAFEFEYKKTDWTQYLIDSYHARKVAENPAMAQAAVEGFGTDFCQVEKVQPVLGTPIDPLGLKKKFLN